MLRRNFVVLFLLSFVFLQMNAQYDPSFSHYFDMETSFNPSAVGKDPKLNVTAAYAFDMAGFENNPRTAFVSADLPFYALKSYHGVGVLLMNDQIGLFTHQRLAVQYAYQLKLFEGVMRTGVQVGFLSETFDGSKLDVEDTSDPAFSTSSVNGNSLDLGFGLYYTHGPWYVGVSGQHLNAPLIDLGETNELKVDATYYLTAGYNIRLRNPFLSVKPTVLVRTDGSVYRADVTGRLVYVHDTKMMQAGVSYSPEHSVTFLIGGSFHGIMLGYSYEVYTSSLNVGNGSHELYVGYQTDIHLAKKGRNKHKSVRIL